MKKTRVLSFSGKGGTGKTTTATLFLMNAVQSGAYRDILLIDADPDANLATTLGVKIEKTVGNLVDQRKKEMDTRLPGPNLRFSVWDLIQNEEDFDLLVMGRTTGEGCYCLLNTFLDHVLEETLKMYDLVLIDFDAGLEHFSRKSGSPMDTLIITCDPSSLGLDTAKRIHNLVSQLGLPYGRECLIGCGYRLEQMEAFEALAREMGIENLGILPFDEEIADKNLLGEPLLSLSKANPLREKIGNMARRIGL